MGQGHAARRIQLPEGAREPVANRQGECRVCFEGGGDLIAPCRCKGTSQWIHRDCMNRWRASRQNPRSLTNCSECGFTYVLDLQRIISDEGEARRRRFVRRIASQGVFSLFLMQLTIIILGLIIRACDPGEELVKIFNFPQTEGGNDSHDFYNAILHHKATYYVAGLIAFFALLGFGGVVMGLVLLCSRRTSHGPSSGDCNCDAWDMYICADCCHSCSYSCSRCLAAPTRGVGGGCDCCDGCDCSQCNFSNRDNRDSGSELGVIAVVVLVVFVVIGVFIAAALLVMAMQRAFQQYAKLQQVRVLAEEYIVRDLADPSDLGQDSSADMELVHQQQMESGGLAPSCSQQAFQAPDPEFQQKMQKMISRDIKAIYEGPDSRQALRDDHQSFSECASIEF